MKTETIVAGLRELLRRQNLNDQCLIEASISRLNTLERSVDVLESVLDSKSKELEQLRFTLDQQCND